MNAGETLETEFVGTVRAVPHTRFHHLSLRFGRLLRLPPGRWSAVLSRFLAPRRAARAAALPALTCLGGTLCDPISSRSAAAKAGASASLTGSPLAPSNPPAHPHQSP